MSDSPLPIKLICLVWIDYGLKHPLCQTKNNDYRGIKTNLSNEGNGSVFIRLRSTYNTKKARIYSGSLFGLSSI